MIVGHIAGASRLLGHRAGWDERTQGPCGALPVRDELVGSVPTMVSAWFPTPDELARIAAGAPVMLSVCGVVHPPVMLGVGAPPDPT